MKRIILTLAVIALAFGPVFQAASVSATDPDTGIETKFGFTAAGGYEHDTTIAELDAMWEKSKAEIDLLVDNNMTWLRFGVVDYHVGGFWGDDENDSDFIPWESTDTNADGNKVTVMDYYKKSIKYAHDKGLKIQLVVNSAYSTKPISDEGYDRQMRILWEYVADSVAPYVDMVQTYNEAQGWSPRDGTQPSDEDLPAYQQWLRHMLSISRDVFKTANPSIQMTVNTYGWPLAESVKQDWIDYIDIVGDQIDVVSMDLYSDQDEDIPIMTEWINEAYDRYHKPVFVAEFGRQALKNEDAGGYNRSIAEHAVMVPKMVQAIRDSKAMGAAFYELTDSGADPQNGEQNFGIIEYEGEHKASFDPIMASMQPTQTNTNPGGSDNGGSGNSGAPSGSNSGSGNSNNSPQKTTGSASTTPTNRTDTAAAASSDNTLANTGDPLLSISLAAIGLIATGTIAYLALFRHKLLYRRK